MAISQLTVELIGEQRQREQVKTALSAIEDPQLTLLESATGLPSIDDNPAVDVTIVAVDENAALLSGLRARPERQNVPLLALLHERSVTAMRRALQAGADELLFMPLEPGYLTRTLINIGEASRRATKRHGGIVCSLVSVTGGVGVTTLGANLGLALKYKLKKEVAFVDLHLQAAGLGVLLDLPSDHTIITLGQTHRALDSAVLSSVLTRHASGAYLLAAPNGIEESELITEETAVAVLQLMSQLFDFIVVDCGSYIDAKTLAVWERSDYLFYVLDQSIIAARSAGRFIDLLTRVDRPDIEPLFLLNKYASDHKIGERQLVDALKKPIFAKLPRDTEALDRVQLTGSDLWNVAPQSAFAQAIVDLAYKLAGEHNHSLSGESPESLVSKLLTWKWRAAVSETRC
jgi:pilus assembly protein CpaE